MFKYIKTIHSHTVAETSRHTVMNHLDIPKGTICQISNGYLVHENLPSKAYYLVVEDKKSEDGKRALDCIRLLPGMMLVGNSEFDPASATIGSNCSFTTDSNEQITMLTTGGTTAEIVGTDGQLVTIIIN